MFFNKEINLNINKNQYNKVKNIIEWYISIIKYEYKNEYISPINYENYLIIISDIIPILDENEKDELIEIGYWLAKAIKIKIEEEFDEIDKSSMFIGLGYAAFSIYAFNKNTGLLKTFSNSLNNILLDESYKKLFKITYNTLKNETTYFYYDCIYGMSGVLNYLLKFKFDKKEEEKLIEILKYLLYFGKDSYIDGEKIINFRVKDDKNLFLNGYIDFGMAHGMIAPLISVSKFKRINKDISTCDDYLNKLLNIYSIFENKDNGYSKWPSRISIEEYINKNYNTDYSQNTSWCYGGTYIANGLKQIYYNIGNEIKGDEYSKTLRKLLNIEFIEYNLDTPILCHGYASLLSIITTVYKETKDITYLYNLENVLNEIFKVFDKNYRYGFKVNENSIYDNVDDDSFLEGTSGIILSLISIFNPKSIYKELLLLN